MGLFKYYYIEFIDMMDNGVMLIMLVDLKSGLVEQFWMIWINIYFMSVDWLLKMVVFIFLGILEGKFMVMVNVVIVWV